MKSIKNWLIRKLAASKCFYPLTMINRSLHCWNIGELLTRFKYNQNKNCYEQLIVNSSDIQEFFNMFLVSCFITAKY